MQWPWRLMFVAWSRWGIYILLALKTEFGPNKASISSRRHVQHIDEWDWMPDLRSEGLRFSSWCLPCEEVSLWSHTTLGKVESVAAFNNVDNKSRVLIAQSSYRSKMLTALIIIITMIMPLTNSAVLQQTSCAHTLVKSSRNKLLLMTYLTSQAWRPISGFSSIHYNDYP